MASQLDYVIAAGIFLTVFALMINYTTGYYSTAKDSISIMALKSEAMSMLGVADIGFVPANWSSGPDIIGLQSYAYRFLILVNNTQPYLRNQNQSVTNLTDELVAFNLSGLGFGGDYNSVTIYDENSTQLGYQISGSNITFKVNMDANTEKWFMIYLDDDSNFTSRSVAVSGNDIIRETLYPIERISLLQYRNIQKLGASSYSLVKNTADIESNFHLQLTDLGTSGTVLDYGADVPGSGNIIALQRYVVFQNETAGIRNGKLAIKVW